MEYKIEDKYNSMKRALERLIKINTNNGASISNTEARDGTEDVFNQLYHFKDWLKKDSRVNSSDVETFVNASTVLCFAGDYCNSFKHAGLDRAPKYGKEIEKVNTHINIDFSSNGPITSSRLEITAGGMKLDALTLARECLNEWDKFLTLRGLDAVKGASVDEARTQANISGKSRIVKE